MGRKKLHKVRVTVSLDKDVYQLLTRIKELSGGTISSHISDFLSDFSPALRIFVQNLEIAKGLDDESRKRLKDGISQLESSFESINEQAVSLTLKTSQQMDILDALVRGEKKG